MNLQNNCNYPNKLEILNVNNIKISLDQILSSQKLTKTHMKVFMLTVPLIPTNTTNL